MKWSSVSRFGAVWLSFEDADSVWIFAKRGVVERISARSKGVLSFAWKEVKNKKKGMLKKRVVLHTLTFNDEFLERTHW